MDSVQPKAVEERPILFQGVAQEVVRGPLTERVHVVLDTRCITLNRGPILALLRGGVRSVSLPLARIVDVEIASRKGQETVFDAGQAGSIKLYGSNGVLFASMLWVLGLPGGPPPRRRGFLATATGTLLRSTKANITVAILTGPAGLALVPKNFLDEASGGGENLRMAGRDILYAKMVKKTIVEVGTRDNVLQFACKSQQGGSQKAFEVLQRLRAIMITADPQRSDVDAAGRKPLDSFEEFPEYLASLDPPLEDPGELLIAGRVVWSPDEWNAYRSTVILGTGQLTLLPDTKSVPPTQMITARTRRGIAPEGETALPMLRIQMPDRTHILRPLGGTGFVKLFWGAIAPHQFLLPGEDFDITPWRPVIGQVRFARVTPDAVVEQILRPALIAKREDGIGIVMCEGEPWDWDPGVFLYLEASRPRGVYRFAGQYLRLEPISELPFKDANHLGANPEDVLRAAIIMPGPLIPELQPAKRSLLRLPTDEAITLVVKELGIPKEPIPGAAKQEERLIGRLADMSAGGCAIQVEKPVPPNTQVIVRPAAGQDGTQVQLMAEVMGTRDIPKPSRLAAKMGHEIGLRFMGLNEARLSWLQREVMRRQRERLNLRANSDEEDEDALPLLDRQYHD